MVTISIYHITLPNLNFKVKTQQGVPGQPTNFRIEESRATEVRLAWDPPTHAGENIISYELYWNDTFSHRVWMLYDSIFLYFEVKTYLNPHKFSVRYI